MHRSLEISPGVFLHCYQDHRFKHGCLSLQLLRPMCRQEAAANALLPAVLLRGCRQYPDLRKITLRLDDLYGASVSALVRRVGDYQTTGLFCSFMEDRYALDGDAVLEPMVEFLGQLLLDPALHADGFSPDLVESEKKNLLSTIAAQLNDKRSYASNQLLKLMCKADPFGIPRLGEPEQVEAITAQNLYAHYKNILETSRVEIFYTGSREPEELAQLLRPLFSGRKGPAQELPPQTPFADGGGSRKQEQMAVAQGKLAMGLLTPITVQDPRFAAMQVCNSVFGGGMTSKLFMNIREKNSLCYDIGSGYYSTKGVVTVSAGIDSSMDREVEQQVLAQLRACQEGDITPQELEAAKQGICNSLRLTHDSPGAIEGYYGSALLSGLKMTPQEYIQAVQQVDARQVAEAAATVQLHSVYFLKGVS